MLKAQDLELKLVLSSVSSLGSSADGRRSKVHHETFTSPSWQLNDRILGIRAVELSNVTFFCAKLAAFTLQKNRLNYASFAKELIVTITTAL